MDTTTGEIGRAAAIEARLFGPQGQATVSTPALISAMLDSGTGISDLIFSPGRPPQVERHGELIPVLVSGAESLTADDTARIAQDLIGGNVQALSALENDGAADFSYSLPSRARFRVNAFRQRGTYAIVMRVVSSRIPTLAELKLPQIGRAHV